MILKYKREIEDLYQKIKKLKKMKELNGFVLPETSFNLIKMGELIWFEGPLLSHWIDSESPAIHYFSKWCEVDATANRWMFFQVSEKDLYRFFYDGMTLREMIEKSRFVYFKDMDKNIQSIQLQLVTPKDIPHEYLPGLKSGYDKIGFEPYTETLKEQVKNYQPKIKSIQKFWLGKAAF